MRPEFWFYEIVTYGRKLLLGGLAVVVGRGTMAQVFFVCTVEIPKEIKPTDIVHDATTPMLHKIIG